MAQAADHSFNGTAASSSAEAHGCVSGRVEAYVMDTSGGELRHRVQGIGAGINGDNSNVNGMAAVSDAAQFSKAPLTGATALGGRTLLPHHRNYWVELPTKMLVYSLVGFNAVYTVPTLVQAMGWKSYGIPSAAAAHYERFISCTVAPVPALSRTCAFHQCVADPLAPCIAIARAWRADHARFSNANHVLVLGSACALRSPTGQARRFQQAAWNGGDNDDAGTGRGCSLRDCRCMATAARNIRRNVDTYSLFWSPTTGHT